MKKTYETALLIVMIVLFLCSAAFAVKPGSELNPNGFPSGPHYNLNIISKKANFQCPVQEYYLEIIEVPEGSTHYVTEKVKTCPDELGVVCAETDIPIYGNVIFVPETGEDIEIYMQSGSGKGKKTQTFTELQVTDPCTGFPGEGAATLQLPPNENGYDVFARALAKPTDNPDMVISPELVAVEDDNENDLIYLGLVTDRGFVTSQTDPLIRTKGKSTAVSITGLFLWSGSIMYFDDSYCLDGTNCLQSTKCCIDADLNGTYEGCVDPIEGACEEGYDLVSVFEVQYDETWVFNIGDFVTYLWNLDNNGLKLLQVRFYPR